MKRFHPDAEKVSFVTRRVRSYRVCVDGTSPSRRNPTVNARALLVALAAVLSAGTAVAKPIAIRLVPASFERMHEAGQQVNACADRLLEGALTLARESCELAVLAAQHMYRGKVPSYRQRDLRGSQALAAALTNRASLELLSGNVERARADIALAIKLRPRHPFVERNRLAIEETAQRELVPAKPLQRHSSVP